MLGPGWAICVGLAQGSDHSYCIASEQFCLKRLGYYFSLNCLVKILKK